MSSRIDTHHHFLPPFYVDRLQERGVHDAGGRRLPAWSAEASIDLMDQHDIATGILSLSAPGVHWGDDAAARDLAREVNEFAADLVAQAPDRFGFFATLPLPDVAGTMDEIAYAMEHLGADGVVLLANANGTYLGSEEFDDVMDELARRSAVAFVHPANLPGPQVPGIPPFAADFLLDTTRAAIKLVASGTVHRCSNLRIILSHAGGFVPYAASRLATAGRIWEGSRQAPKDVLGDLRSFYFDTALSGSEFALPALTAFAGPDKITYGSDFPFAGHPTISIFDRQLEAYDFGPDAADQVARGNAESLFPRLAGRI